MRREYQDTCHNDRMQNAMNELQPISSTAGAEAVLQQLFKPKFTDVSIEQLRRAQQMFAAEREWEQFHTPRNLLLALVGEVGELSEIFQWKGDTVARDLPTFTPAEKQHVAEEVSDVLLYLVRFADICGIDLGQAVLEKLQKNAAKYPVDKCRGSAARMTPYQPKAKEAPARLTPQIVRSKESSEKKESEADKRKRFTEEQVDILSQLAEQAGWSLLAISQEERDQVCEQYGISKERLQNFFNNRKPRDLKKPRSLKPTTSSSDPLDPDHGNSMNAAAQQHYLAKLESSHLPIPMASIPVSHAPNSEIGMDGTPGAPTSQALPHGQEMHHLQVAG